MRDKYNLNILDTEDDAGKSILHRESGIYLYLFLGVFIDELVIWSVYMWESGV